MQFVSGAKEMCFALWTAGYWADFIDPTTGTAVSYSGISSPSRERISDGLWYFIIFANLQGTQLNAARVSCKDELILAADFSSSVIVAQHGGSVLREDTIIPVNFLRWQDYNSSLSYLPPQFFASPSSQTTLQTDEQLRHLGFHIEVSGSCTVIRHILRGTPLFVGTVFTNAPANSAAIARLQGLSNILDDEE